MFQQTQNPDVKLPAWPVRVACDHMMGTGTAADNDKDTDKDTDTDSDADTDTVVLERLRDAGGVLYNVTGAEVRCSTGVRSAGRSRSPQTVVFRQLFATRTRERPESSRLASLATR